MKSSSLSNNEQAENNLVSTAADAFENASRSALAIAGGRSVISAAASIDLLYIDAQLGVPIALPFMVTVNGIDVLFDQIEPSPVVESSDAVVGEGDVGDVCEEIVESFSRLDVSFDRNICIEASNKKALLVKLTTDEYSKWTEECETCFGYTTKRARCKNKRKSLRGEKIWCYHHTSQERDYRKYLTFGDLPVWCEWWKDK